MSVNYTDKINSLKLSDSYKEKLIHFVSSINEILKHDDFKCFALYGDVLGDNFREGVCSAGFLIIPAEAGIDLLEKLHIPVQSAAAELKIVPLIMTFEELLLSADVFPVKFLEIKSNYTILTGEDLLAELSIPSENIRLHCEQELRNFSLRLRNDFINIFPDEFNMHNSLIKYLPELLPTIKLFVEFKSGKIFLKISEALTCLKEEFAISYEAITEMIAMRKNNSVLTCEEIKEIYSKLNILLNELTRKADAQ
jgi:hypothetical protein